MYACDRRVRTVADLLVGRANGHPPAVPGDEIPVAEARHDRPVAGRGVRFHVDDLPAGRLDRHVKPELGGEAGGPRPAGHDDRVGLDGVLAGLDASDGPAFDPEPVDGRVTEPEAVAPTCGP